MAISTTQSIWRSGGGDTTRTAYCGSGLMAAEFYIPSGSTSVVVQASATNESQVILPAGAVVLGMTLFTFGQVGQTLQLQGAYDNTTYDLLFNLDVEPTTIVVDATTTGVGSNFAYPTPALAGLEAAMGSSLTDPINGFITYFVQDPLAGQQNV